MLCNIENYNNFMAHSPGVLHFPSFQQFMDVCVDTLTPGLFPHWGYFVQVLFGLMFLFVCWFLIFEKNDEKN